MTVPGVSLCLCCGTECPRPHRGGVPWEGPCTRRRGPGRLLQNDPRGTSSAPSAPNLTPLHLPPRPFTQVYLVSPSNPGQCVSALLAGCRELWQQAGEEAAFLAEAELPVRPLRRDCQPRPRLRPLEDPPLCRSPRARLVCMILPLTWHLSPILGEVVC